jgi:hypothetical protein
MSLSRLELAQALLDLQSSANICARIFTSYRLKVEYRIVYTAGACYPWRLLESHQDLAKDRRSWLIRRMHCFDSAEKLKCSLTERAAWKAKDRALVAAHLGTARHFAEDRSQDAFETARAALGGLDSELAALEPQRRALRARMCVTRPDHVLNLLH